MDYWSNEKSSQSAIYFSNTPPLHYSIRKIEFTLMITHKNELQQYHFKRNSTLRFRCRPASVSFDALGCVSPKLLVVSRVGEMLFSTR